VVNRRVGLHQRIAVCQAYLMNESLLTGRPCQYVISHQSNSAWASLIHEQEWPILAKASSLCVVRCLEESSCQPASNCLNFVTLKNRHTFNINYCSMPSIAFDWLCLLSNFTLTYNTWSVRLYLYTLAHKKFSPSNSL